MTKRAGIWTRVSAVMGAVLLVIASGVAFLLALFVNAMRCDEGCEYPPVTSWHDNSDAWQWDALLGCAGIGLLAAICTVVAVLVRKRAAIPAAAISLIAWGVWWLGMTAL